MAAAVPCESAAEALPSAEFAPKHASGSGFTHGSSHGAEGTLARVLRYVRRIRARLAAVVLMSSVCGVVLAAFDVRASAAWSFLGFNAVIATLGAAVSASAIGVRVFAAFLYAYVSVVIMAGMSVVAWYRNPNHMGFLPDVVHEFVPVLERVPVLPGGVASAIGLKSWLDADGCLSVGGLEMIEVCMATVIISTVLWALTQPSRWLIFRRAFIVYGTLALWRCVTIFITTLPDASPRCTYTTPGTVPLTLLPWRDILMRTAAIIVGEVSDPCRSAGDMVFSGHSMVMVMCGMVWHAYYPVRPGMFVVNPVKVTMWALISFTLVLIIICRLHYTLDVILAIYFAVTLFNAYHRLADDVLVGHRFVAVWMVDGLLIYPAVTWLEAPELGEARRSGMVSRETDYVESTLKAAHLLAASALNDGRAQADAAKLRSPNDAGPLADELSGLNLLDASLAAAHQAARAALAGSEMPATSVQPMHHAAAGLAPWPYCCPHHFHLAMRTPGCANFMDSPCQTTLTLPRAIFNADGGFRRRRRPLRPADDDAASTENPTDSSEPDTDDSNTSVRESLRHIAHLLQRTVRTLGTRSVSRHSAETARPATHHRTATAAAPSTRFQPPAQQPSSSSSSDTLRRRVL